MSFQAKPSWIKVKLPSGKNYKNISTQLRSKNLHTVCEEALCPNIAECWETGTATLMLLGEVCTRGCRFCAVKSGNPKGWVDPQEPQKAAETVKTMNLSYVVLTMVDRDDLADGGAKHIAKTINSLHRMCPETSVEILASDFQNNSSSINTVLAAYPEVFAHNIETTEALSPQVRDRKASYKQSLDVLEKAKIFSSGRQLTKSSIMLGLGESKQDLQQSFQDLRDVGVNFLTLGQYLRPSQKHLDVVHYYRPEDFEALKHEALGYGFDYVASGPLVRSSYKAAEFFIHSLIQSNKRPGQWLPSVEIN